MAEVHRYKNPKVLNSAVQLLSEECEAVTMKEHFWSTET